MMYNALFTLLIVYRVLFSFLMSTQFDPDEFHQTLEPAFCSIQPESHPCKQSATWEWSTNLTSGLGPYRSSVNVLPYAAIYSLVPSNQSGMVVKLLNAVVAVVTDYSIYMICRTIYPKSSITPLIAVFLSATNWFNCCALVRSYANSFECSATTLSLYLLSPLLVDSTPTHSNSNNSNSNSNSNTLLSARYFAAFFCGGICVCVRFSALFFYLPLGIFLTFSQRSTNLKFEALFGLCAPASLLGVMFGVLLDRLFFGFWCAPFLSSLWFNVVEGKASLYGTHPFHWYFSQGLPAIAGLSLLPFLLNLAVPPPTTTPTRAFRKCNRFVLATYLVAHSISPHKEFRFLLPILPLICIESGDFIGNYYQRQRQRQQQYLQPTYQLHQQKQQQQQHIMKVLAIVFLLLNLPHAIFLSTLWQGGAIKSVNFISNAISISSDPRIVDIDIFLPCYSSPLYSYIRSPNIHIYSTDCSPTCRRPENNEICESDRFEADPFDFIANHKHRSHNNNHNYYVVTFFDERVDDFLTTTKKLTKLKSFFHTFEHEVVVYSYARN